jgi:hypothetical protein
MGITRLLGSFNNYENMKTGKYLCGCAIGTPWQWLDKKGRFTFAGATMAATIRCTKCNKRWKT